MSCTPKKLRFAIAIVSLSASAQIPPVPAPQMYVSQETTNGEPHTYISGVEIAERIAKADAAAKAGTKFDGGPMLLSTPFRANMEYRTAPSPHVNSHENEDELFVVLEGSGTITLGGALVNPTRKGSNLSANSRVGGITYKLVKGDMVLVPHNTPHSLSQVDGKLVLMSLHLPLPAPEATPPAGAPASPP